MQNGSFRGPREDTLPNAVVQDDIKWTALHEAAAAGDHKKLETILTANVDRTSKEAKHGNTPLHEAAWRGYSNCVKALCTPPNPKKLPKDSKKVKGVVLETRGALHSALLGIRNDGGFSALHLAAQNGHNQSCREILLAGGDPDVQNNYGDTPLHTACRYGHAGATRILLSATCDPNKTNLNGDTSLHIACAMGRRKLTRILLEAGSNMEIKNGQNETPRDIAARKRYNEILEILNNPTKMRSSKSKDASGKEKPRRSRAIDRTDCAANQINWSPYGCHYFPDPRTFPSPKLDTLPKEPLRKGEQYFLDLGGNIRKGPVGVGNTCYCGPFFRHIEEKISRNRKSIRKYVHKATEKLDNKVQALALKTDDQIEQLTRSMIADRIRCEGRRLHMEHWLKRGEPYRLTTTGHPSKSKKNLDNANTLTRCKSLDVLDDDSIMSSRMQNSRSFDVLDGTEVTVHRAAEQSEEDDADSATSVVSFGRKDPGLEADYYSVSERLEELLAKTNEILEMEKEATKRRKDELLAMSDDSSANRKTEAICKESREQHAILTRGLLEQLKRTSLHDHAAQGYLSEPSQKELERKEDPEHEQSSILSENSNRNHSSIEQPSSSGASHFSVHSDPDQYQNLPHLQLQPSEHTLQSVISALRKDRQMVRDIIETEYLNETDFSEDKLSYKGDQQTIMNGFFHNTCFDDAGESSNNTLKSEKVTMTSVKDISELCEHPAPQPEVKRQPTGVKDWRRVFRSNSKDGADSGQRVNGTIKKVEIKNSEIKTLKRPTSGILKRSKVQELVARIQGKWGKAAENDDSSSESSEDEQNEQNEHLGQRYENTDASVNYSYNRPQPQIAHVPNNLAPAPTFNNGFTFPSDHLVPKDAYFHELPNRNRPDRMVGLPKNYYAANQAPVLAQARTRNPLLYTQGMEQTFLPHHHQQPAAVHSQEKLLSNRKFGFAGDYDVPPPRKNCNQLQQQSMLLMQPTSVTPEQPIERDMSNDSGFSMKIYGGSHGPSPSLSGHTDYGVMTATPPNVSHLEYVGAHVQHASNDEGYFLGNASSLV